MTHDWFKKGLRAFWPGGNGAAKTGVVVEAAAVEPALLEGEELQAAKEAIGVFIDTHVKKLAEFPGKTGVAIDINGTLAGHYASRELDIWAADLLRKGIPVIPYSGVSVGRADELMETGSGVHLFRALRQGTPKGFEPIVSRRNIWSHHAGMFVDNDASDFEALEGSAFATLQHPDQMADIVISWTRLPEDVKDELLKDWVEMCRLAPKPEVSGAAAVGVGGLQM